MMSLDTEIRRDTNPTPTRFLLECGAFTPGLGFNLESCNPFDASLKFPATGTPKTELNPFDSSFRTPSTIISVLNNSSTVAATAAAASRAIELQQKHSPWSDIMFDEVSMPMPQMSPGLSPSSTFTSASPSPPIHSPPTQTISLSQSQFHPSMAIEPHATRSHTFDHNTTFDNLKRLRHSDTDFAPQESFHPDFRNSCEDEEYDEINDHDNDNQDVDEQELINRRYSGVSTVEAAMSTLDMRRLSTMSDIHSSEYSADSMEMMSNEEAPKTSKTSKTAKSKKAGSRKTKNVPTTKSGSRKRATSEEETPESKRQKFLERNRMAASKCREKKRLQTLKTISDADEITARNQALHETLNQLQEEVRHLKNQILSHRDCGCDVIQKFAGAEDDRTNSNNKDAARAEATDKGNETETEAEVEDFEDDDSIIDHTTFDQLLEMDDEEDHEFSKSLVWNYFEQAEKTFGDMDEAMKKLDFPDLSRLGHFLKGSSAALGLTKVKESCEKLQHYGNRKDAAGASTITNDEAESLIKALLIQMRKEYDEAEKYLREFYAEQEQ
ncbi:hypothetical protein BGZ79_007795 [Entomortierella chlamydospora]|nr:hypothetical protein BGZ79_007795 [Entomortierella chlamydospora]